MIKQFQNLHHSNIVLGGEWALGFLKGSLEEAEFKTRGNPDYLELSVETFGIDEARGLALWSIGKPIAGERKVAALSMKSITSEAQNALLKTLEEPTLGTYFFFVMRNLGGLLPTFLSRAQVIDLKQEGSKAENDFLEMDLPEKIALIKKLSAAEDKEPMRDLLKSLPEKLQNPSSSKTAKKILIVKKLVASRGSSPKMLLEWLTATT